MTNERLIEKYIEIYGKGSEKIRIFSAPGRVNLIGEHTDYNGGYVFPIAISFSSRILVRPLKNKNVIRLAATDLPDRVEIDIDNLDRYKKLRWGNYQAGVIDVMKKQGYHIQPCEILYHDEVPLGAGLSSSAAIEMVMALTLETLSTEFYGIKNKPDMIKLAKIAQQAEIEYCGLNCGIMDQFASAMGKKDHAIFLDCKDLSYKYVPFVLDDYKLVITHSNKKRSLLESKYNERCAECAEALNDLKTVLPDISCLRDVTVDQFEEYKRRILNPVSRNRAEHVIYECDRVLKSVEALQNNDLLTFGNYLNQSQQSLHRLYEVTGLHLDTIAEAANSAAGCIGSRMTGAGFGGCNISIVRNECIDDFENHVSEYYFRKTGIKPSFTVCYAEDGAKEIRY